MLGNLRETSNYVTVMSFGGHWYRIECLFFGRGLTVVAAAAAAAWAQLHGVRQLGFLPRWRPQKGMAFGHTLISKLMGHLFQSWLDIYFEINLFFWSRFGVCFERRVQVIQGTRLAILSSMYSKSLTKRRAWRDHSGPPSTRDWSSAQSQETPCDIEGHHITIPS